MNNLAPIDHIEKIPEIKQSPEKFDTQNLMSARHLTGAISLGIHKSPSGPGSRLLVRNNTSCTQRNDSKSKTGSTAIARIELTSGTDDLKIGLHQPSAQSQMLNEKSQSVIALHRTHELNRQASAEDTNSMSNVSVIAPANGNGDSNKVKQLPGFEVL